MFRKAGITEANSAFNMWSDARYSAAAPTLADFLNWMPSNETQDDGVAEDIQESAEAAFTASSHKGPSCPASPLSLSLITPNKLIDYNGE
jgi:hypothetical protein